MKIIPLIALLLPLGLIAQSAEARCSYKRVCRGLQCNYELVCDNNVPQPNPGGKCGYEQICGNDGCKTVWRCR